LLIKKIVAENTVAIMLIWCTGLKRLRNLTLKSKKEVIRMFDQVKEIFTEIEEIELSITNKKKIKIPINILTMTTVFLNST